MLEFKCRPWDLMNAQESGNRDRDIEGPMEEGIITENGDRLRGKW